MIHHSFLAQGRMGIDEGKDGEPVLESEIIVLLCHSSFG